MGFEERNSQNPQFTDHCFTGDYPIEVSEILKINSNQMTDNKLIALITGAGSGIGAEIAKQLAQKNIHTIITDKNLSGLQKLKITFYLIMEPVLLHNWICKILLELID